MEGCTMNEVVQIISQLVSNLGFPIACVCVMFWQQNEERKTHAAESEKWVEALNRNTVAIERLCAKIGAEND